MTDADWSGSGGAYLERKKEEALLTEEIIFHRQTIVDLMSEIESLREGLRTLGASQASSKDVCYRRIGTLFLKQPKELACADFERRIGALETKLQEARRARAQSAHRYRIAFPEVENHKTTPLYALLFEEPASQVERSA